MAQAAYILLAECEEKFLETQKAHPDFKFVYVDQLVLKGHLGLPLPTSIYHFPPLTSLAPTYCFPPLAFLTSLLSSRLEGACNQSTVISFLTNVV